MSVSHLTVVSHPDDSAEPVPGISERVRLLQAEARDLAREHLGLLTAAMAEVSHLAADIAEGGEAYPVGARELCRHLSADIAALSATLGMITERTSQA